jgi:hypothetical protein
MLAVDKAMGKQIQVKSLYRARKDPAEEHMTKFTLRHWQWWHSLPENASKGLDAPDSDRLLGLDYASGYRAIETMRQVEHFAFVSNATCSCNSNGQKSGRLPEARTESKCSRRQPWRFKPPACVGWRKLRKGCEIWVR